MASEGSASASEGVVQHAHAGPILLRPAPVGLRRKNLLRELPKTGRGVGGGGPSRRAPVADPAPPGPARSLPGAAQGPGAGPSTQPRGPKALPTLPPGPASPRGLFRRALLGWAGPSPGVPPAAVGPPPGLPAHRGGGSPSPGPSPPARTFALRRPAAARAARRGRSGEKRPPEPLTPPGPRRGLVSCWRLHSRCIERGGGTWPCETPATITLFEHSSDGENGANSIRPPVVQAWEMWRSRSKGLRHRSKRRRPSE